MQQKFNLNTSGKIRSPFYVIDVLALLATWCNTRVDTTIDYNRMFDSEIIIDFKILIDEVLRRLADGNRLSQ